MHDRCTCNRGRKFAENRGQSEFRVTGSLPNRGGRGLPFLTLLCGAAAFVWRSQGETFVPDPDPRSLDIFLGRISKSIGEGYSCQFTRSYVNQRRVHCNGLGELQLTRWQTCDPLLGGGKWKWEVIRRFVPPPLPPHTFTCPLGCCRSRNTANTRLIDRRLACKSFSLASAPVEGPSSCSRNR